MLNLSQCRTWNSNSLCNHYYFCKDRIVDSLGCCPSCKFTACNQLILIKHLTNGTIIQASKLASALYGAMVEKPDYYADREIQVINFKNLMTTANNGITTFKAVQQVKQLLGDIADDLTALVEEDEDGRRLAENTCDHLKKDKVKCGDVNDKSAPCQCDDHRYTCECKLNYSFIKLQSTAGCDGVDSDNDFYIDICEDRFPPRLVFTKPETFMCDLSDPDKLCFDSETFLSEEDAMKFIRSQVNVNDDCATQSQLSYDLAKLEDSKCSSTLFRK